MFNLTRSSAWLLRICFDATKLSGTLVIYSVSTDRIFIYLFKHPFLYRPALKSLPFLLFFLLLRKIWNPALHTLTDIIQHFQVLDFQHDLLYSSLHGELLLYYKASVFPLYSLSFGFRLDVSDLYLAYL